MVSGSKLYGVYDTHDNDVMIGEFTSMELKQRFGLCGGGTIRNYCKNGIKIQGRYRIEVTNEKGREMIDLLDHAFEHLDAFADANPNMNNPEYLRTFVKDMTKLIEGLTR